MKICRILLFGVLFLLCWGCSSPPPVIALLTDYGSKDHYVGSLQGAVLSINPKVQFVTITHEVPSFDIREGSYILATAARDFPAGTIFLAVVDPGVGNKRRAIIIETLDKKYFVGPDNGIFTDVIRTMGLKQAVEISNVLWYRTGAISSTFHGRDVFGPAAARLAAGDNIEDAGAPITDPQRFQRMEPILSEGRIKGEIWHRDHYGNLITNIPAPLLAKAGWRTNMTLEFDVSSYTVRAKFSDRYSSVPKGEFVIVLNSLGLLEIARYLDSAGDSLGAVSGSAIEIRTAGTPPVNTPADTEKTSPPKVVPSTSKS
jgi:hypothetical protein